MDSSLFCFLSSPLPTSMTRHDFPHRCRLDTPPLEREQRKKTTTDRPGRRDLCSTSRQKGAMCSFDGPSNRVLAASRCSPKAQPKCHPIFTAFRFAVQDCRKAPERNTLRNAVINCPDGEKGKEPFPRWSPCSSNTAHRSTRQKSAWVRTGLCPYWRPDHLPSSNSNRRPSFS